MTTVPHAMPTAYAAMLGCAVLLTGLPSPFGLANRAEAATLRTMTTLHGPRVKLSDLFDDAGTNANRVLGPGPAPGGRIVVDSAQLAATARPFEGDWDPAPSAARTA